MKSFLLAAGFCLATTGALAQVSTAWINEPGGVSIAVDAADNVFTANWEFAPAGDITLTKRNSAGSVLWQAKFDNLDTTRHEVATWVATDSAGNAFVSGTIRSGTSNPVNANSVLMKFSPQGQLLWRQVYDAPFDGSSTTRVLTDTDNTAYVLGLGTGPNGQVSTVRKFAPDGSLVWAWFDPVGVGAPVNLKWTPERSLLIIARGVTGANNGYAKIDRNGTLLWTFAAFPSLTVGDAAGDNAGNTFLVNGSSAGNGTGSIVTKLRPNGGLLTERLEPIAGFRIEVPSDQGAIISGFPNSGTAGAAFMRFDSNLNEIWRNLDADGPGFALLLHAQMKLDAADNAYLAAGTLGQMAVTRINADGSNGWTASMPYGNTYALALGSDNAVYAVGGNTAKLVQGTPPPPPVDADLKLTMTDAPDPVRVGANLVYTVTVTNQGPAAASGVTLRDVLPKNVSFVSAVPAQGTCTGTTTVNCTIGNLGVGSIASVAITVKTRQRGTVKNTATTTATQVDPNGANNSATATTTVQRR
jgi:uncharacterized repeat protein (TIGR01451 family)